MQLSSNLTKAFLVISAIAALLSSCDNPKGKNETTDEAPNNPRLYRYQLKEITHREENCQSGQCTEVTINLPVFEEGIPLHESLNKRITQNVRQNLSDLIMNETKAEASLDALAADFLSSHEAFKANFPESTTPWYVHIDVTVGFTTDDFISLGVATSSYTGGAHSNNQVEYLNMNRKGELLTDPAHFVQSLEALEAHAETTFRKTFEIPDSLSFADKGYLFENDEFQLTNNFGFTKAGMVFYYNSYEIAPYGQGPSVIVIPFYELEKL